MIRLYITSFLGLLLLPTTDSQALQITSANYQDLLNNNKIVLINFYADWCMFSQQLAPIFHKSAELIHEEYQNVKLGRLDCEAETQIALQNSIAKYPTIKIFRNGKPLRKEYRGQRSVDAFSQFVKAQMKPAVVDALEPGDLKYDNEKNTFIGYFKMKDDEAYKVFEQLCDEVYETVDCIACLGEEGFSKELAEGENLQFKPKKSLSEPEAPYTGSLTDLNVMRQWLNDKANPLVREITFENGEELTEEGLPFLLLFHRPGDTESVQRYKNAVQRELIHERDNINFLTADGTTFSHPLHHLGKSINDLPLICIDSFRHMYLFKKFENVDVPGKLTQFVKDLHSGKLHQDFHNPPPEEEEEHIQEIPEAPKAAEQEKPPVMTMVADGVIRESVPEEKKARKDSESTGSGAEEESGSASSSSPPETIFQKLAPSENRYTLLHWRDYSGNYRDEL